MGIPTLIVGLGGTGVLTLRALKRLYEGLPENERVPAAFLAYDFDRSAMWAGDEHDRFGQLEDREFFHLNPTRLQELLRSLDQRTQGSELAWDNILCWFPDKARVPIPSSEVEANGASQLRCLGRLGFFLNDELIEYSFRRALSSIELDPHSLSDHKRVILVSSVAGGTGAGMLIDMAYLARRQEIRPSVWTYLLLPDVFEDVDSGGRIFQNAYACLKELTYLKKQSIPFKARYYRIAPVEVEVGGDNPFERIFLARGEFSLSGSDAIKRANIQIAEMILAQLQRDIQEKCLSLASDKQTDYTTHGQKAGRMPVFGAASSSLVKLNPTNTRAKLVFKTLQRLLGRYNPERKELEHQLRQDVFRRRQRVFETRSADTRGNGFTLIMLPPRSPWPSRDRADLEAAISPILESRVLVENYAGAPLWTYHEDIFHPLGNIKNIRKYLHAYQQQEHRELFHIDRRMLENPAFRDFIPWDAFCGNPACYGDIEFVSRSERICPYCGLLIRSRCGNLSCTVQDLGLQEKGKRCPVCSGYNHAAWWSCTNHGRILIDVPVDKEFCPLCIEEHEKDPVGWPISMISLRPDLLDRVWDRIICPRCADLAERDPSHIPYTIPRDLESFYRNGVSGHDESLFAILAKRHLLPDGSRCPVCRTYIVPLHIEGGSSHFVFLFRLRGSHVFVTARDPECRYELLCGYCEFPLARDSDQCPRCQRFLTTWARKIPPGGDYNIGRLSSALDPVHDPSHEITASHPEEKAIRLLEQDVPSHTPHAAAPEESADRLIPKPVRNRVFISYSRKDKEWLDRLRTMLRPLERNHPIHVWSDNDIRPGDKWKEEIWQAVSSAKVAVLLISSNFLASDFISQEELPHLLKAAEHEGVRILWILVSHCPYEATPIGAYKAVHDPNQALDGMPEPMQNRVLSDLARAILEAAS